MHFKSLGDHMTTMFTGLFLAWCLHFDRADFLVHICIVYIFDFLKETTVLRVKKIQRMLL
jgi:hypothetical protein